MTELQAALVNGACRSPVGGKAGPADLRTIVADRVRGVPQETGRVSVVSAFFRGSASGREAAAVYVDGSRLVPAK